VLSVFPIARNPMDKSMGFTLIELMVVVAILVILTTLGIPSYRAWIQNTQIYNATESALGGLQKAKAEAVKQNVNVEFVLGASYPWKIQVANSGVVETSTSEGSKNVTVSATLADGTTVNTLSDNPTNATTITFNNLGGVATLGGVPTNANGTAILRQIDFNSGVLPTSSRKLRVTIGNFNTTTHVWAGSNIRMCDPNLATGSNPRAC
jgi:type IV fimbrial biogenesis protein FimT